MFVASEVLYILTVLSCRLAIVARPHTLRDRPIRLQWQPIFTRPGGAPSTMVSVVNGGPLYG